AGHVPIGVELPRAILTPVPTQAARVPADTSFVNFFPGGLVKRYSTIRCAALAAVAALGIGSVNPSVAPAEVVIEYNTYCVGYRANLYDADWRLRCAQADQWQAQDDLAVARRHEGEVALVVEDRQVLVDQYAKRVAE